MNIFYILKLFGGLALLIYGMITLGNGLEKLSGGKLEKILEKFSNTPVKGVLLGTVVTAVIQSSSATTVMVVGFVNSGIMRLSQATGIIMGANIGTTITAWILSLTGLKSDNVFIQIVQPKNFTMVFAVIGIIFLMFTKTDKKLSIGQVLIGFTILIIGMDIMSAAVIPLKENPDFANILLLFSNPILGVLLGTVITGILQSSSASVGILQALAATTSITVSTATPIILGQNIGTCVTAFLSSIGTNKNAKRVAVFHLYFNVIGAVVFLSLIYIIKKFVIFNFWNDVITPVGIAAIHSIFNISSTLLFLPFTKFFEKLAHITIKGDDIIEDVVSAESKMLEDRFLLSPSFALEQCKSAILKMANYAIDNLYASIELCEIFDKNRVGKILKTEHIIDSLEDKLGGYLIKLNDKDLSAMESRLVSKYLHSINDFERIADHAENIMEIACEINKNAIVFSNGASSEMMLMSSAVKEILSMAVKVFENDDIVFAGNIEPLEEVIDLLRDTLKTRHLERLKSGACTIETGIIFNDLLTNFERISDHCSNIAVYVIELKDEKYTPHEYLYHIKEESENNFSKKYDEYKAKYYNVLND